MGKGTSTVEAAEKGFPDIVNIWAKVGIATEKTDGAETIFDVDHHMSSNNKVWKKISALSPDL